MFNISTIPDTALKLSEISFLYFLGTNIVPPDTVTLLCSVLSKAIFTALPSFKSFALSSIIFSSSTFLSSLFGFSIIFAFEGFILLFSKSSIAPFNKFLSSISPVFSSSTSTSFNSSISFLISANSSGLAFSNFFLNSSFFSFNSFKVIF